MLFLIFSLATFLFCTVTTLMPQIGKLMYKDYKQVRGCVVLLPSTESFKGSLNLGIELVYFLNGDVFTVFFLFC